MAQVSEMMFTFQLGKTSSTFTPNRSLESTKPKQTNFKDDLTAARNVNRKDDNDNDSRPQLQKTQRDSERVNRAERKLNKKVAQKPQDEKEEKKPIKFKQKIEDDLSEILNLLNNVAAAKPSEDAATQTENSETLEAVKELANAVKTQNLDLTGGIRKDISKLLDLLKEFAGKTEAAGDVKATAADISGQIKELVDSILQAKQGSSTDIKSENAETDALNGLKYEKVNLKEQDQAAHILYKLNRLNYELKNLTKAEGQGQGVTNSTEAAVAVSEVPQTSKENEADEAVTTAATDLSEEAVKPEEKTIDSNKPVGFKTKAAGEAEEKLQNVSDKKEAVKEAREEKSDVKAAEKQEVKKTPEIVKTDSKKVALDSKQQTGTVYKNDQILTDKPFEKVMAAVKTDRTANVPKADVINQIVKKAEVAIGDKQSEMRMQLEPENLGKLTLKVAIERGVVTAKFVAESQQVKEIIETNFNQLKDALQEKGINVQSFSVSVGQDNNGGGNAADNYKQMWQDNIRSNSRNINTVSSNYVEAAGDYTARPANPYSYHDGKVDFKA